MNFDELYTFLNTEFQNNPALDGELPSFVAVPDYPMGQNTTKASLKDELLFQLNTMLPTSNKDISKHTCKYIIDSIDTRGYLTQNALEISTQLNISHNLVDECILIIQGFEPLGVGAANLSESLLIQATSLYPKNLALHNLISHHLSDLLHKRFDTLVEKTPFSLHEIKAALDILKTLNPVPGNGWCNDEAVQFITPDILLFDEDEGFRIEIPMRGFDKLILNPSYTDPTVLSEYKQLIKHDLNRATTILQGLQNRQGTLYQIATIIITRQLDHLKSGNPLSSLQLIDIARQLGIHESTASRGIDGKYILYNEQIIELRSLLSRSMPGGTSVDQIKKRLSLIIKGENKEYPFSDPQLVEELKSYGLEISRRTVAKYRQELWIGSAKQRKTERM